MQQIAAFFDVDETLINIKSMLDFFDFWCRENNEQEKLKKYMESFHFKVENGANREQLNRDYYRQFSGVTYKNVEDAGEKWFKYKLKSELFIESSLSALKKHQAKNTRIVFISGSMFPILSPIAKYLGVENILCAPLKLTDSGIMTGEIGSPQTIGSGKKEALIQFCIQKNINPLSCFSYGDDISDIPMLTSTGHPVCVGKGSTLAQYALEHRWLVI